MHTSDVPKKFQKNTTTKASNTTAMASANLTEVHHGTVHISSNYATEYAFCMVLQMKMDMLHLLGGSQDIAQNLGTKQWEGWQVRVTTACKLEVRSPKLEGPSGFSGY